MSRLARTAPSPRCRLLLVLFALVALPGLAHVQADTQRVTGTNYKQAYKYSPQFLGQFIYGTSVTPSWIGKTDTFWYQYRTSKGTQWYRVNPREATKEPLFDRVKLAAQLSEQVKKPLAPEQLPLTSVSLNEDATKLKFVTQQLQFEYDLRAEKLTKIGKAPVGPVGPGTMTPEQLEKMRALLGEERFREFMEQRKEIEQKLKKESHSYDAVEVESFSDDELRLIKELLDEFSDDDPQQKKGGKGGKGVGTQTDRVTSPDGKFYAFAKNHDLYVSEKDKEDEAVRLSNDSAGSDYTFNAGAGFGGNVVGDQKEKEKDKDKKARPNVTWSKDSKAFYATRNDQRGVKELFLVNSVAAPRPTLMRYKYAMPGEERIRKSELYVFSKAKNKLIRVEPKWKDEWYTDLHWGKNGDELRFVRNDRMRRSAEFCTVNTQTGEAKCLILEGFENAHLVTQPVRYLDESNEMIWWSERSSWGHFYLYDRTGKPKNAITAGDFRASSIVNIDPKNRVLYFRGNAREPGDNVYFNHVYSVHFDGTGLTLLDPGCGDHNSILSPSKQYVVDNCSRFDLAPFSVLRDHRGNKIMDLEKADLSKLYEVGWKMPETFTVKAADGVTDLYGNLWKPFDFDPKKRYPVIAHVYPGPQTESMAHAFTPNTQQQQLAQLGFIVIQVGNRGGTPLRSKNYQSHSYWNMRDYGLADKKTAIEQLAAKHAWVDIDRIGIYGHSGGGFMSAAALLQKPYNDFFKVAVSSAGNHDNNVYNNSWAERYHGLKEVPASQKSDVKKDGTGTPPKKGFGKGKGKIPPDEDEDQDGQDKKTTDDKKGEDKKVDDKKTIDDKKGKDDKKDEKKEPTRFDIYIPTNAELAGNLKGKLLLVHGDMDNNVHHVGTMRLADALIKANKRFDILILPGKSHGFADYQPYFTQRMWEYFAEHLLDDRSTGADIYDRKR